MKPERWRRVEELYHSALRVAADQRAGFLKNACRGDAKLCEEVESLLAYESSAQEFMETPAFEVAAKLMAGDEAGDEARENQADPVPIGATLQRFRVLEKLGRGGMGVVYKAEDTRLHRSVALKFLPKSLARDPASLERFEREANAASALNHPNICTVYDIGEHEGQAFIAMELLEGQTLDRRIGGQPLPTRECLTFAIQITEGLHAAHQKGIIHRDIKPANIFVTSEGQAKILDFGIAKLLTSIEEHSDGNHHDDGAPGLPHEVEQMATPGAFLSRTGVAMGTAGYMSPEQARGEKLDARTDLFSFGLVLYEMATGHRAFSGDTGPELHDAIFKQVPAPARKLNPWIPPKLEPIINRALQKDREARYPSAAELHTDLESLKQDLLPKPHTLRWLGATAGILTILLVSTVMWIKTRPPSTVPNLKLRQLTINSSENPVTGGAISPNGKYLAYTDAKGLHIKFIETDEALAVPPPEGLKKNDVAWEIFSTAWFPDSTRFLANAHPASENPSAWSSQTSSIWMVSVSGGAPRKLRDNSFVWSVSPDGSSISFGTNKGRLGDRELWLMGPDGKQARKLYEAGEKNAICCLSFLPNGRRALYISTDESGDTLVARDLKGGPVATLLQPSEMKKLGDSVWLPDGRMIYSDPCNNTAMRPDTPCNYWIERLDTRTGEIIEKPRRLTSWVGLGISSPSTTADSRRVAFLESSGHGTGYLADLEAGGTRISNLRHFTLDEGDDAVANWTADSKAVIVVQNRGDHYGIYKQSSNTDTPEPIVTRADGGLVENALLSPDGKWVLTQIYTIPHSPSAQAPLMRVSITGGSPELIFAVREGSSSFCARFPSNLCAVAEATEDNKQMIVTAFDPLKGRGPELARFDLNPDWQDNLPLFDISPDGTRLVFSRGTKGPIEIHSVHGQLTRIIQVEGLSNIRALGWAGDGKGLLVSSGSKEGTVVLHLDLRGKPKLLWRCAVGLTCGAASSPDGRHLAINDLKLTANMWMMENF